MCKTPKKIHIIIITFLIGLFTFLIFSDVLRQEFFAGEEYWFTQGYHKSDLIDFFTKNTWPGYDYVYRPITQCSYYLDFKLWGYNPFGYHVDTLLLYSFLASLLFLFYNFLTKNLFISFVSAIIFIIIPAHQYQINIVSHRGDVIPAIFLVLTLINYWVNKNDITRILLNSILLILAYFTKENMIISPCLLLLLAFYQAEFKLKKFINIKNITEFCWYAFLTLAFIGFRFVYLVKTGILAGNPENGGVIKNSIFAGLLKNNELLFLNTESLSYHNFFLSIVLIFWTSIFCYLIWLRLRSIKWTGLLTVISIICSLILWHNILQTVVFLFFIFLALLLINSSLFGAYQVQWVNNLTQKIGLKFHKLYFDNILLFSSLWIVLSNWIMFSRARERLTFNASIGYALFVAILMYIFYKQMNKHKISLNQINFRTSDDSNHVGLSIYPYLIGGFLVLMIIYVMAGDIWRQELKPDSYMAFEHSLVWYPSYLKSTEIWKGRKIDQERLKLYQNYLIKYHLIDKNNTLLVKDETEFEKKAYQLFDPSKVNEKLYNLKPNERPKALYTDWKSYQLLVQ